MNRHMYGWVVLGLAALAAAGCDIGSPNDMARRQELMRENRTLPSATEMPPGLGEDLPSPSGVQPLTSNK